MSTAVISAIHVRTGASTSPSPSTGAGARSQVRTGARSEVPARPRLRITRRGQLALTILVAIPVVCVAIGLSINGGGAVATASTGSHSFQQVSVEPGQSLWQLAVQVAPHADPRSVMADIAQLNQLDNTTLQPGQNIAIPKKYAK